MKGHTAGTLRNLSLGTVAFLGALTLATPSLWAQQTPQRPSLTLRQAVAQAVEHSQEIAAAHLRYEAARRETNLTRSQFLPNLYAGSGAAYSNGFPLAAGGGAPSLVSVSYNQAIFDPMARGAVRASEQHETELLAAADGARDAVILRVASAYLELAKLRRSQEILSGERASAARILSFTRERVAAGLELPIEVTRAQLTAAKIEQSIAHLDNGTDNLADQLRADLGLAQDAQLDVATEDLPEIADPDGALVERAIQNSIDLKQAAAQREANAARLQGERGSRWPTLSLQGQYNVLGKFNDYDVFFNKFRRNNIIAGVQIRLPIFSARASSGLSAAQANLRASQAVFDLKRVQVSQETRQKARQRRESNAAREVARLELDLAQQNTAVVQAQFNQGRASLRDLESAQLTQNDKWLAFLDADFASQKAQLDLMQATGQVGQLAQ